MPLFSNKHNSATPAQPAPVKSNRTSTASDSKHSGGLFSRHRDSSSSGGTAASSASSASVSSHRNSTTMGGLFHRNQEDPTIAAARERVAAAERAEADADRALTQARASVRTAREQVKQLELEAAEDARRARIKQEQASQIGRRAKPLGRHG